MDKTEIKKKYDDYPETVTPVYFDECIMGNVLQAGLGQNPGRQAGIYAGLPEETNAITVNKVCASGMKAIALAAQAIRAGDAEAVVAGGMENMSNAPFALPDARWGYRMSMPFGKITDLVVFDGLYEIFNGYHMGFTAENIAARYGITRREQDELALVSHQRARAAIASGAVADEIVPVIDPPEEGGALAFGRDERPMDTSLEKMAKLAPAFKKEGGTVTAGNASGINDGAAAVVVMAEDKAKELGLKPLARIKGYAAGGVDPAYMGLGPDPGDAEAPRQTGTDDEGHRSRRTQRGLRRPGDRLHAGTRDRPRQMQPERERHLHRPPRRLHRRPDHLQPRHADAEKGPEPGSRHTLHRRRPGNGDRPRTGLKSF